jgi:hypothetical protein
MGGWGFLLELVDISAVVFRSTEISTQNLDEPEKKSSAPSEVKINHHRPVKL